MDNTRREFLKKSALGAGIGLSLPELLQDHDLSGFDDDQNVIVFQGDSITDAGRNKEHQEANNRRSLGGGYAGLIAAELLGKYPKKNWQCHNRGISGHKVHQLAARWQEDCIDLKPDVLSILIGVNDFWHTLTHDYKGTVEVYDTDLRMLLDLTLSALPDLKLIIAEPFVVDGGTAINNADWFPAFNGYREAARSIAKDYKAAWVPFQEIFDKALDKAPVEYWCPDGVHPSPAGNYLMAQAWIKAFKKLR
ncbi:MAG: SGNH/GDSL hydrolase family protein [Rhodothermales bacterium]